MTKYIFFILISIQLTMGIQVNAQVPDAHYDFNSCNFSDNTSSYLDAIPNIGGAPSCVCGVNGDALEFNGSESLIFPDLDLGLRGDFALSFYFWPDEATKVMELFSISSDKCKFDSVFTIRYLPALNQVKVDIIETGSRRVSLSGDLKDNLCWHHLLVNNTGEQYELYLDGKRIESEKASKKINIQPNARVKFSGSPCIGDAVTSYKGLIDEFKVWERSLEAKEIQLLDLHADKIISEDQTIFLGEEVQISTGGTCSNNFSWSPSTDITNIGNINPLVKPTESRTYILETNHRGCRSFDTINIYVLDIENLDCNNLLLPDAFTPNNDGINEDYGISNPFIIETLKSFDIYDRWANTVFQTNNKEDKWDGSFNGEALNPGLYVYKISYSCKQKNYNKTGSFTILK